MDKLSFARFLIIFISFLSGFTICLKLFPSFISLEDLNPPIIQTLVYKEIVPVEIDIPCKEEEKTTFKELDFEVSPYGSHSYLVKPSGTPRYHTLVHYTVISLWDESGNFMTKSIFKWDGEKSMILTNPETNSRVGKIIVDCFGTDLNHALSHLN